MEYIADIGKNFINKEGIGISYKENAFELIKKAKESGATIAKFQTHVFEDEQKKRDKSRYEWIKYNENITPLIFWEEIKKECDRQGIEFMTTPMSKLAAEKVNHLVKRWKVSSADIVDYDLLEYLKSTKKPTIISTGMSNSEQVNKAITFLGDQIEFINYCVSLYPCPIYKIDLEQLVFFKTMYGDMIGFSDHSLSIEVPVLATRMGVKAIEKHFTLDRNAYGPDHKVSLLPEEFKQMVDLCNLALNEGESFQEEKKYWDKFRINNK
jgi:N,N'-diacetyllegionaminate synthase